MSQAETLELPQATSSSFARLRGVWPSVTLSATLHACVLLVLAGFWNASAGSEAPIGVRRLGDPTLIEVGFVSHAKEKTRVKVAKPRPVVVASVDDVAVKKEKEEPNEEANAVAADPGRFGARDGVVAEGALGVANGQQANEMQRYIYELRVLLEGRKIYPKVSRYMRETGKVRVRFVIKGDGEIDLVEIAAPSQFERLNNAAHELVKGLKKYKPLPGAVATASLKIDVPIEYVLN